MKAAEWLAGFASRLGTQPPTAEEFTALLEVAAEAAHASERIAAPAACWVAARSGRSLDEALRAAHELAAAGETASGET